MNENPIPCVPVLDGVQEKEDPYRYEPAPLARRLAGSAIDWSVAVALVILVDRTFAAATGEAGPHQVVDFLVFFVYFFIAEAFWAQTLGKRILSMEVCSVDGHEAEIQELFSRTFARLIPFDAFSYLLGFGLHDRISGTTVKRVHGRAGT